MTNSLWGSEFIVAPPTKHKEKKILEKAKKPLQVTKKVSTSKSLSIEENMKLVETEVNRILGRFKDNIVVINKYEDLVSYIDNAIDNGVISIRLNPERVLSFFIKILAAIKVAPNATVSSGLIESLI